VKSRLFSLLFLVLALLQTELQFPGPQNSFVEQALNLFHDWDNDLDINKYKNWIEENAGLLEERFEGRDGDQRVELLNLFIFRELNFQVRRELENIEFLFLNNVIDQKAGYCVGLATLYIALGEQLGLPIYGVSAPGHVFVRYDDGTVRRNIELTEKGRMLPDEEYVRRYKIPEESIEQGVFLRNLTHREFQAQILNNRGVILSRQERYKEAEVDYRRALKLDPLAQTVYYNRGNDWLLRGKYRKSLKDLTRAIELNPNDAEAWNNRGVCFMKMGKEEEAKKDFEKAMSIKPGFQRAVENLKKLMENSK